MMEHKFPLLDAYVTALGESDAVRYLCVCLVLGFVESCLQRDLEGPRTC